MAIHTLETNGSLDIKKVQKLLIRIGKAWSYVDAKEGKVIEEIKNNASIYNILKPDEKEFVDLLREWVASELDDKPSSESKKENLSEENDTTEETLNNTPSEDEMQKRREKKDIRLGKLKIFLRKHPRFDDHGVRNVAIVYGLIATLAVWGAIVEKIQYANWKKENAKMEALWEQEKKQDRHVLVKNAVHTIQNASDQYGVDEAVRRYTNTIEDKRDTLRMEADSIFSRETMSLMQKFEAMYPEEAKAFFTQFLNVHLSRWVYRVDIGQIESWLSPYAHDMEIDSVSKAFLKELAALLTSYAHDVEEIDKTYTDFDKKIMDAKNDKYQELWLTEAKNATAAAPTSVQNPKKKLPENKNTIPIHSNDKLFLMMHIINGKTNLKDLENAKAKRDELVKKIQERDHKKEHIDIQTIHDKNELEWKDRKLINEETQQELKEAGGEQSYYDYARAIFAKLILFNIDHSITYKYRYKPSVIKYKEALVDSFAKSPTMQDIQKRMWNIKSDGEQIINAETASIKHMGDIKKSEIDNQYSGAQKELHLVQEIIEKYNQALTLHIDMLESIIHKNAAHQEFVQPFQQWKNTLEEDYGATPESIDDIIIYKLDTMFYSYNFEDKDVIKKFTTQVKHISALTGLSKETIYAIAAPYIREDMQEVSKSDLKMRKAIARKLNIRI